MPVRKASAEWKGDLKGGSGRLETESGVLDASYSFPSRFETGEGTNPEELVGAALAGCFSMAFANGLAGAGHPPESVRTEARVHFSKGEHGFSITEIELACEARVPGIDQGTFADKAEAAKEGCPMSGALAVPVRLEARLL